MYLEALLEDRKRDMRERAIAARIAQASREGWEAFMRNLRGKQSNDNMRRIVQQIKEAKPKATFKESDIEWQK